MMENVVVEPETRHTVCLFLPSGKTFTFQGCRIDVDTEAMLCFGYRAASDGQWARAVFQKSQIVGYSKKYVVEDSPVGAS